MRKFLAVFLVCLTAILVYACRKLDAATELEKVQAFNPRFFNVPASASPQAKAIAEAIKQQDAKYKFVEDVVKKAG